MTTSPRLPADLVRRTARRRAPKVTEAELDRVTELALRRDARTVTIGHGRSAAANSSDVRIRPPVGGPGAVVCSTSSPGRKRPRPGCVRRPGSPPRTRTCGSWRARRAGGPR